MEKNNYVLLILLLLYGCMGNDFTISAPKAPGDASSGPTFEHALFLATNCVECHAKNRPVATPVHGDGYDCSACHTSSLDGQGVRSWKNLANFNHSPAPTACLSCHQKARPPSTSPHLSGQWGELQDCVSCHTYPQWTPTQFDHAKPLVSCIECHRILTKDDRPAPASGHPTSFYNQIDCVQCHTNSDNNKKWSNLLFDHRTHSPTSKSCMRCHEIKRPLAHQINPVIIGMLNADCASCHTSTSDWKQVAAFDHELMRPTTCMGCHASKIPSNQVAHPSVIGNYSKIDCAQCHTYDLANSARSWSKIIFNHYTHLPSPVGCRECHQIVNNSLPANASHAVASRSANDCVSCHRYDAVKFWTNFSVFQHGIIGATERCDSCHKSAVKTLTSKPLTHITTAFDCNSCHSSSAWKPASYTHSNKNTDCVSCHNGTIASGKTPAHVSTVAQCSTCHTNIAWKPATFVHATTDTNCLTCHNGTTATGKTTTHVPTTAQCSTCHSKTAWKPAIYVHATTDTNCLTCHNGTTATGKTTTHVPTVAQCSICHTNAAWKPATFVHATTDTNCLTCHNGTTATGKTTTHVPTVAQCSTCHSKTAWKPATFVHATTDTNCLTCHNGTTATGKTTTHVPTVAQCSTCHSKTAWKPATFVHATTDTNCLSCHNGTIATGKTTTHVPTTAQCSICHTNAAWKPATYVHATTDTNCLTCHNGTTATGKTTTHVPTTAQCSICHTNAAWIPATYTHATADTNCLICHNGTTATGKPTTHVATTAQCSNCHTKTAWTPAGYTHAVTDTNCTSCHNGSAATARPASHTLPLANHQCSACHSQISFLTVAFNTTYKHSTSGGLLPKGTAYHKSQTSCTKCHLTTTDSVKYNDTLANSVLSPKCAGCHTSKFGNKHGQTTITTNKNCLSCHSYNGW